MEIRTTVDRWIFRFKVVLRQFYWCCLHYLETKAELPQYKPGNFKESSNLPPKLTKKHNHPELLVKHHRNKQFYLSEEQGEMIKIPKVLFSELTELLAMAA